MHFLKGPTLHRDRTESFHPTSRRHLLHFIKESSESPHIPQWHKSITLMEITLRHFWKPALFTEIEQKVFTQLPADICCILSRNLLRTRSFHRDRSTTSHCAVFGEPAVSTDIHHKAFTQLPRDLCCILSRNFLRTRTFHRDRTERFYPTSRRHLLHFIKESSENQHFPEI